MAQQRVQRARHAAGHGRDLGRGVQRVGGNGKRQHFAHCGAALGRQRRQRQAMVARMVGHQNAYAARAGENRNFGVAGQRARDRADIGDVEHLLDGLRAVGAALGKHRVVDRVVAGQRAGMRGRGRGADFGASGLHDQHRLAGSGGLEQRQAQAVAVLARLDGRADHAGLGVVGEVVYALGDIDIGLVAGGDDLGETQAAQRSHAIGGRAEGAALRGQRDMALDGAQAVERGGERRRILVGQVEQAQRVRAQHAHIGCAADVDQLLLQRLAGLVDLGKARSEDLHRFHALGHGFAQRGLDPGRGNDDHRLVDAAGHLADALVGLQTLDQGLALVDRVDSSLVAAFAHETQHASANALRVGGGADQRHRFGKEEGVDCLHGDSGAESDQTKRCGGKHHGQNSVRTEPVEVRSSTGLARTARVRISGSGQCRHLV